MPSSSPSAPTLEELLALGDEVAAMVRAGVPLEAGLATLSRSPGRLSRFANQVHERLQRGEPIEGALAGADGPYAATYRAVVEAGLRSGRLGEGLEAFSRFGRSWIEFRRVLRLAVTYPVIVLAIAYAFLVWTVAAVLPRWSRFYADLGLEPPSLVGLGMWLGEHVRSWILVGPVLLVAGLAWAWWSRRAGRLGPYALIPSTRRVVRSFHVANFCDLLALLADHGVPLSKALELAGTGSGSRRLEAAAEELARAVEGGASFADALQVSKLPEFVRSMLATGERQGGLAVAARQAAAVYRSRAGYRISWLGVAVPVTLTAVFGGGAVLTYALMLWLPMVELLNAFS